ncbi:methyltransferase domain-containing protein [Microlunatus speluncae]|uniref:methyltransferase domain-containing protein n=1 Tax=Microlunatus speluncae TaxID=2594267 RepID=UPI0012663428|nr:methyltransferase domain-containing protein [Microlunatus speluncae]
MLISSRTLAEYRAMFELTDADLAGAILDCAAGGSSFVAELGDRAEAVATDPAYERPVEELARVLRSDRSQCVKMTVDHGNEFVWDWYGTPERRDQLRQEAAERFLADRAARPERYRPASLPELPFADDAFDLVLCSHLLFTWAGPLDRAWHAAAITELIRVSRGEVRLYPLVHRGAGDPVPFLGELAEEVRAAGHRWTERAVDFRFQRRAGVMAVITK